MTGSESLASYIFFWYRKLISTGRAYCCQMIINELCIFDSINKYEKMKIKENLTFCPRFLHLTATPLCNMPLISVNVLKLRTLFSFCSQIKCWFSGLEFTKCLSVFQTEMTLIRLLLQKQSDLGLHCLSMTGVRKFRTSGVYISYYMYFPCLIQLRYIYFKG